MNIIQHFDKASSTYTYIIASHVNQTAVIIDPVLENIDHYLATLARLNLQLQFAIDTHTHADHVSGRAALRDKVGCVTVLGRESAAAKIGMRVADGDIIDCGTFHLKCIYTPGHTDDSYSFLLDGNTLFTGDILLIGATGRTDFQNGNAQNAYDSLTKKILTLPDDVLVYPAHDYKENLVSTIGYEKAHNPRLQTKSAAEYATLMASLNLPYPKMIDIAVPANINVGNDLEKYHADNSKITADAFKQFVQTRSAVIIDLREAFERARDGEIQHAYHFPYSALGQGLMPGHDFEQFLKKHEQMNDQIILACNSDERPILAHHLLTQIGYKNISWYSNLTTG